VRAKLAKELLSTRHRRPIAASLIFTRAEAVPHLFAEEAIAEQAARLPSTKSIEIAELLRVHSRQGTERHHPEGDVEDASCMMARGDVLDERLQTTHMVNELERAERDALSIPACRGI